MQLQLQLDDVQARGGERIGDPIHWPVYFALDDTTLRSLAGDVAASDWIHAPGAAAAGSKLVWQHTFPERADSLARGRIGYGLLYSAGGANDASTQAAYQELVAIVHALVLGHAARENGMAAMLAAFGGRSAPDDTGHGPDLGRLRDGIDPERLSDELDRGLTQGIEAFRAVAETLMLLEPGAAIGAKVDDLKPLRTTPVSASPKPALPARLAPGTVVAVTLQAWRVDEIPSDKALEFARALPTRGVLRASLRLSGRVIRGA